MAVYYYDKYCPGLAIDSSCYSLVGLEYAEQIDLGAREAFLLSLQRLQDPESFLHPPHSVSTEL